MLQHWSNSQDNSKQSRLISLGTLAVEAAIATTVLSIFVSTNSTIFNPRSTALTDARSTHAKQVKQPTHVASAWLAK